MPADSVVPTAARPVDSTPSDTPIRVSRVMVFVLTWAAILYLELKPQPSLTGIPHVPAWLQTFCDHHDFANNVIGFGALMAATHYALAGFNREAGGRVLRRAAMVGLGVVVLECVQLMLPHRSADWHDVLAGWLGIAAVSTFWLRGSRPIFPS